MKVKPVRQVGKPKYPLKTELNDEELKQRIPKRWIQNPAAKAALGALAVVALTAGCAYGGPPSPYPTATEGNVIVSPTPQFSLLINKTNVAPLFIHGEGRGAFGGVSQIAAYISESEALNVINEAALGYGLEFSTVIRPEIYNALQPVTELDPDGGDSSPPETFGTLIIDFSDTEHGVALEFVSKNDIELWSSGPSAATAWVYDAKDAASQLIRSLERADSGEYQGYSFGVLYEPFVYYNGEGSGLEENEGIEANLKKTAEEQLKKQAIDFFEWLKAQGVI